MPDRRSARERDLDLRIEASGDLSALRPVIEDLWTGLEGQEQPATVSELLFRAKLALLFGMPETALELFARAGSSASDPSSMLAALDRLVRFRDELPCVLDAIGLVRLFLLATPPAAAPEIGGERVSAERSFHLDPPAVIVAGGTGRHADGTVREYHDLVIDGLRDFSGTVISGGTAAGVSRMVGDLQERRGPAVTTVGYLPAGCSGSAEVDGRYRKIVRTAGSTFSVREPIRYWEDILGSRIAPAEVRLIGINGGAISAMEYRIACALGARVGVVPESGGAAAAVLEEPFWKDRPNLVPLPDDVETVRAFVAADRPEMEGETRERLARAIHEEYRAMRLSQAADAAGDPSLAEWQALPETLRRSNYSQAETIERNLNALGFRVVRTSEAGAPAVDLSEPEYELLAEMEHGRWNADRLLDGWRWGPKKDVERKLSPHLVPWRDLPDDVKEYDRNAVRQIPALLDGIGYLVTRAEEFDRGA